MKSLPLSQRLRTAADQSEGLGQQGIANVLRDAADELDRRTPPPYLRDRVQEFLRASKFFATPGQAVLSEVDSFLAACEWKESE